MQQMLLVTILMVVWGTLSHVIVAREIIELESTNLELTLTAYRYLAILFYDDSKQSSQLLDVWEETAAKLPAGNEFPENSEIGKVRKHELILREE